jgi:hypothetical protein
MFFSNYRIHKDTKIRKSLLWEYDLESFDWHNMRNVVVQRVIERGRMDDFYAVLNLYGLKETKEAIKQIPYFNPRDISFVCSVFGFKKNDLQCFTRKQLDHQHWNS